MQLLVSGHAEQNFQAEGPHSKGKSLPTTQHPKYTKSFLHLQTGSMPHIRGMTDEILLFAPHATDTL